MAEQYVAHHDHRQERCEPCEMRSAESRSGRAVSFSHVSGGSIDQLAIVIASYRYESAFHQLVRRASGVERAGNAIAKVDGDVGRVVRNVGEHGLQGAKISMYVCDGGDAHLSGEVWDANSDWENECTVYGAPASPNKSAWLRTKCGR